MPNWLADAFETIKQACRSLRDQFVSVSWPRVTPKQTPETFLDFSPDFLSLLWLQKSLNYDEDRSALFVTRFFFEDFFLFSFARFWFFFGLLIIIFERMQKSLKSFDENSFFKHFSGTFPCREFFLEIFGYFSEIFLFC